jgi:mRNA-degrading endonuclease RelE of RelBE toxin-antitoxin system
MNYQIKTIRPFEKAVHNLAKKFRNIKNDLKLVIQELEVSPYLGVSIPGYDGALWKLRVANTSAKRGKQGGFRIIYLIEESEKHCYLLLIYSKTEKSDVTSQEIEGLLRSLDEEYFPGDS